MKKEGWMVRRIDKSERKILKVEKEIVRKKDGLMRNGVENMKKMKMRMVEDEVGMKEQKIRRVKEKKFMEKKRGVFELR